MFPDTKKEGLEEDDLIANIKEAIEQNHEQVKIWNLSISITRPVVNSKFSDLAIALDDLQGKFNVLICKSAGNCSNFLSGRPKGRIHEGADSVRSLVVGSIAHKKSPDDFSEIDNPSPFSWTGYTGEDGFEVYTDSKDIAEVFEAVFEAGKEVGLMCCGLGCRDTLRFEAALPLYGHELAEDYRANEVALGMFVKMDKTNFIGKSALESNPPVMKRKGVKITDKGIAREGCKVYDGDKEIGFVTTGTMSPTLGCALAMVRINKDFDGETVEIDVRGRRLKAEIVKMPFYKKNY